MLWKSPLIPSDPMLYRKNLSADLKARIKAFFLGYGRIGPNVEKEKAVLAGISAGLAPFKESSNDQLIPIREIALAKARNKLLSDTRLDKMEKDKKLAEIDGKLDMLRKRSEMLTN